MTSERPCANKELYQRLRLLSCKELWQNEVTPFDSASSEERIKKVALIRAVGVVFSERGTPEQKDEVRLWLRRLLYDPSEKIRRYAMAALPKIGAGLPEESALLTLLRTTPSEREKKFIAQTLEKIGGTATLVQIKESSCGQPLPMEQKIRASLARSQSPSAIRMDSILSEFTSVRIHLRGRQGLEPIVRSEVEEHTVRHGKFRITGCRRGLVAITPVAPFCLADIYALRCFASVGFVLGFVGATGSAESIAALASVMTSPLSRRILETFTEGSIRYRLEFVAKGHQRGAVRLLASRAYALCPDILNDARSAPWVMAIHPTEHGNSVELCPKLPRDPRFYYRRDDVPAASHPPLAACMARLAGRVANEVVWDPCCGSGLELIERALLGGVSSLRGTDHSAEAIAIAQQNFAAANLKPIQAKFTCCDFRDYAKIGGLGPNTATLIITNPPLGKRVPIPDLSRLIQDLFSVAATVLRPGGRLVFTNPLRLERPHPLLELQSRQVVDLGVGHFRLEKYLKRC